VPSATNNVLLVPYTAALKTVTWYLPCELGGSCVNQISTYRPLAGVFNRNCTVPPTSDAVAATGSSAGSDALPTRI
jgi:hypothetical protein